MLPGVEALQPAAAGHCMSHAGTGHGCNTTHHAVTLPSLLEATSSTVGPSIGRCLLLNLVQRAAESLIACRRVDEITK